MLKLLLDVSCLGYATLGPQHRTGLFQVTLAYAQELRRYPDVELGFYSSSGNRSFSARCLREEGWNHQPWVGSRTFAWLHFAATSLEFAAYRSVLRPLTPLFTALRSLFESLRAQWDRRALLRWEAYLSPMEAVPEAIRAAGLKVGIVVHDLIPVVLPGYRQDPSDPTRWFSRFWRTVKRDDLIFTVSQATRGDWLRLRPEFPAERVVVAPNAVDFTRFQPLAGNGSTPYFLAISTIEPRKRYDAILAGYQAYREAGGTTPLWIGGQDKHGILRPTPGVRLLGFVDDAALPGLYASCTAFLSFSEYEGFGLPILEAMACGAPVVISRRTSHPEVGGDAAVYIDPDDVPSIARALALMDHPAERAVVAGRCLARAQSFSWTTTVAEVVRHLQKDLE